MEPKILEEIRKHFKNDEKWGHIQFFQDLYSPKSMAYNVKIKNRRRSCLMK